MSDIYDYTAAHNKAKKAIYQAQQLYQRVLDDPNTKIYLTFDLYRDIRFERYPEVASVPKEYSAEVTAALSALNDARAVVAHTIRNPNTPQQRSRNKFQKELKDIDELISYMDCLQEAISAK